jgi:hypothetical protein
MTDWATTASLATAAGTLVLAIATFGSTRSANRAARTAERAMLAGLRPLLQASRLQDPAEKVMWSDVHFAKLPGGQATMEVEDGIVYMACALRNVGPGIAVLRGWQVAVGFDPDRPRTDTDDFRRQGRDIYIAPGDYGYWHAALREPDDPLRPIVTSGIDRHERMTIDLLYGDFEGGQRTVTRVGLTWRNDVWIANTARHWNLDRDDPR